MREWQMPQGSADSYEGKEHVLILGSIVCHHSPVRYRLQREGETKSVQMEGRMAGKGEGSGRGEESCVDGIACVCFVRHCWQVTCCFTLCEPVRL